MKIRSFTSTSIAFVALASSVVFAPLAGCSDAGVTDATASPAGNTVQADQVEIVKGVADGARDPAVVALDIAGDALCSGSLIAPDVLLTARHCVAHTSEDVECPAAAGDPAQVGALYPASSFTVFVGDDIQTAKAVAHGKKVFTTPGTTLCDEDIALIVLDREVTGITPLTISQTGIAKGKTVRAVGYGKSSDTSGAGLKLLRDHVKVQATSADEFVVGESTCNGDSGGPAIDDATGEIVGVVSRGGPDCDSASAHNIYTRADAFLALIDQALAYAPSAAAEADAGAKKTTKKSTALATDVGGACSTGDDCSSGVCVSAGDGRYCSQACDAVDICPTGYACVPAKSGDDVCVQK